MARHHRGISLLAALALLLALPGVAAAVPIPTLTVREVGTGNTVIVAGIGSTVHVETVLDTAGMTFEGYIHDLSFTPGTVSSISFTNEDLSPLDPDFLTTPSVGTDGIDDLNQGSLNSSVLLPAGTYMLNAVSFTVDAIPGAGIEIDAFLGMGDFFSLDGGSGPQPGFVGAWVVPEPETGLLVAAGLALLARPWRRRRRGYCVSS